MCVHSVSLIDYHSVDGVASASSHWEHKDKGLALDKTHELLGASCMTGRMRKQFSVLNHWYSAVVIMSCDWRSISYPRDGVSCIGNYVDQWSLWKLIPSTWT